MGCDVKGGGAVEGATDTNMKGKIMYSGGMIYIHPASKSKMPVNS